MAESAKTIGFRGSKEYRRKLQQAAMDRGLKVQGLIERAIESYLGSASGNKPELRHNIIELPISKLHEGWYADLTFILREGRADDTSTLKSLIEYFIRQIRERGAREGGAPAPEARSPEGDNPDTGAGGRRKRKID